MKRIFCIILCIALALFLFACAKPQNADNLDNNLTSVLRDINDLKVTDDLITLFFDYYSNHPYELRLLPTFTDKQEPDWDELTHFVYSIADRTVDENNNWVLNKEVFDSTVKQYFGEISYTHKNSAFVYYTESGYTPTGWDDHGAVYYRLKNITKNNDNSYTAEFDGIHFNESDFFDEFDAVSSNMKAILKAANTNKMPDDFEDYVNTLILEEDYNSTFKINETITISFILSNDSNHFIYKSSNRNYINYDFEALYEFKNISTIEPDKIKELVNGLQYAKELPIKKIEIDSTLKVDYQLNMSKDERYNVNHTKLMGDAVILLSLLNDIKSVEFNFVQENYGYGGVPITKEDAGKALGVDIDLISKTKEVFLSEMPKIILNLRYNPDVKSVITYEDVME